MPALLDPPAAARRAAVSAAGVSAAGVSAAGVLTRPLAAPGAGEGLDHLRPRRRVTARRAAWALGALAVLALAAWALAARSGGQTLRVPRERLALATVAEGPFQEFASVSGTVQPLRSVVLGAVVGGQVVQRLVEEGDTVRAGQPLFVLANGEMALQVMSHEAQLEEQAAALRQNRLALDRTAVEGAQAALAVDREIAQLDYDAARLARERDRTAGLVDRGAAAPRDLDALESELAFTVRRRALAARSQALARAAQAQDATLRAAQLRDMSRSVGRLRQNLAHVRGASADLVVRAPVAGQVSSLAAEVGELTARGDRLGQIDVLDAALVRAAVDEHYLARVAPGQAASATVGGTAYRLAVRAVYPAVAGGRFQAELVFDGPAPAGLRRGQSVAVRIALGAPAPALLLPRGPALAETGGEALWVLAPDGRTATRRPVALGRQSPSHAEVLGGLAPGERVVVSSYAALGRADRLELLP